MGLCAWTMYYDQWSVCIRPMGPNTANPVTWVPRTREADLLYENETRSSVTFANISKSA